MHDGPLHEHLHDHHHGVNRSGAVLALLSALLFGVTTPLSKLLLGDVSPWLLAGLLYLGSGGGLLCLVDLCGVRRAAARPRRRLRRSDLPWLAGLILTGGVVCAHPADDGP